jgi:alpha-tubulin suppressor-like RCC1 family protein
MYAWGSNTQGQLGIDVLGGYRYAPVGVRLSPEIGAWTAFDAGTNSSLAVSYYGELWSWGYNGHGRLGHGTTGGTVVTPTRVLPPLGVTNWADIGIGTPAEGNNLVPFVSVSKRLNSSFAVTADGRLFAWGDNGHGRLGIGSTAAQNRPALVAMPPSGGTWRTVVAGEQHTLAISTNNTMYSWGWAYRGGLGNGTIGPAAAHVLSPEPISVPAGVSGWRSAAAGDFFSIGVTTDDEVFVWGHNAQRRLGLGVSDSVVNNPPFTANQFPLPVPLSNLNQGALAHIDGWSAVFALQQIGFALSNCGHLYTWGWCVAGTRTGAPAGAGVPSGVGNTRYIYTPTRVATPSGFPGWESLAMGQGHTLGICSDGNLFVWGDAGMGRLGHGVDPADSASATVHRPAPHMIAVPAGSSIESWGETFVAAGSFNSVAVGFRPIPPPVDPVGLTKNLRTNLGVTLPDDLYFNFIFEPRRAVLADEDSDPPMIPPVLSQDHNMALNMPAIHISELSYDTSSVTGGVRSLTQTGCIVTLLDELIEEGYFPTHATGVFVWSLRECGSRATDPGTGRVAPSHMHYDDTVFEMRVHMLNGYIAAIYFLTICPDTDRAVGAKHGYAIFTNTYTRQIGTLGTDALEVTKHIPDNEGNQFANLATDFGFTLTLTNVALGSDVAPVITFPFTAYVYEGSNRVRTESITSSLVLNFNLRHGQRLVIPQLPAGASFSVSEAANPSFAPSYTVALGGNVAATGSANANTVLTTGTHFLLNDGRNAADFINSHQFAPPTGLLISSSPWTLLVVAPLASMLFIASKRRKSLEEGLL